jgi:hypothetical protein
MSYLKSLKYILFSSGASVTACRATGRHIVALEADETIFSCILEPMKKIASPVTTTAVSEAPAIVASQDPDAMTIVPRKFVRRSRPSK